MKFAIIYTRVSTDRQGKHGIGLQAQEKALREFAERNGFNIAYSYPEVTQPGVLTAPSAQDQSFRRRCGGHRTTACP